MNIFDELLSPEKERVSPTDYKKPTLVKGCLGEDVKKLQALLRAQGYSLAVDGGFGDQTYRSVVSFQTKYGLVADGIVGMATWEMLSRPLPVGKVTHITPTHGKCAPKNYPVEHIKTFKRDANSKVLPCAETIPAFKSAGKFPEGYPVTAILHFTGGSSASGAINHMAQQGLGAIVIDRDGKAYYGNGLDGYTYHAGVAHHPAFGKKVSQNAIGFELVSAGRVEPTNDGSFLTYYGKRLFKDQVRYVKGSECVAEGYYEKFTPEQESALRFYLLWLKWNNNSFDLSLIRSHEEVSPKRKNDVGGALSMSMHDYRLYIQSEFNKLV